MAETPPETESAASTAQAKSTESEAGPLKKSRVFLANAFFGGRDKPAPKSPAAEEPAHEALPPTDAVEHAPPVPAVVSAAEEKENEEVAAPEPVPATPPPVDIPPAAAVVAPPSLPETSPSANPQPRITMPSPETPTNNLPDNGRATAQLTLPFEVVSLQLTPFFRLGAVQLRSLSNVVSLHLMTTQSAGNPLAAAISFQIDQVELDGNAHFKSILLKPLGEAREMTAPLPKLQVDNVAVSGGGAAGAPISVTTSQQASTAVNLLGTFTIAAMDFTPAFEIGSLRLEPASNTVLLRVAPSARPAALDLPPAFEIAEVQLGDGAQISGARVTPSAPKTA